MYIIYLQVSGGEDTEKLQDLLGDYKKMSGFILRGTTSLMGVERQPATPLPSSKYNNAENHFDRTRDPSRQSHSAVKLENKMKSASGPQGQDTKVKNTNVTSNSSANSNRSYSEDKSSLVNSAKTNRTDHQRPSSQSSTSSQKSSSLVNSQKLPKPEPANQSVKKEPTLPQSIKPPPVSNREPVLQSLNQELIGQSRKDTTKSISKPAVNLDNKVSESSGKFDSVLKEKEVENRNTNRSKNKNGPKIVIPEVRS